jgi:hypothetical protein
MEFTVRTAVASPPDVLPAFGDPSFVRSIAPRFLRLDVLRIGLRVGDALELRMHPGFDVLWNSVIVAAGEHGGDRWFVDRSTDVSPARFGSA